MDLDKTTLAKRILTACEHESLNYRQAGKLLNIPSYNFSLLKKEKYYKHVSRACWERISEWASSNKKISQFMIPEDEKIIDQYRENEAAGKNPPYQVTDDPGSPAGSTTAAPTVLPDEDRSIKSQRDTVKGKLQKINLSPPCSPELPGIAIPPLKLVLDIDIRISVNGILQQF